MRPIKFRGKCCHSDAWAYGNLVDYGEDEYPEIQGFDVFRENDDVWKEPIVERDTIGQFTGLLDKNGKEIYEGDILQCGESIFTVSYEYSHLGSFSLVRGGYFADCFGDLTEPFYCDVIGNIHDNPELLEGGEG